MLFTTVRNPTWLIATVGSVCLGISGSSLSARQPGEKPAAAPVTAQPGNSVAPEAKRVLDRVRAHFAKVSGVSVTPSMLTIMKMGGEEQKHEEKIGVIAARPNLVAARVPADDAAAPQMATVCDGKSLTVFYGIPLNKYEVSAAPKSFGGIMEAASLGEPVEMQSLVMRPDHLVLALLDGTQFDDLVKAAEKIEYVGKEDYAGHACERVRIAGADLAADFWVPAEGDAWIDKVVPDMSKMFGDMEGIDEKMKESMPRIELQFKDWKPRTDLSEATFKFTPPEGAQKVDSLTKALEEQFGGGMDDESHDKLLGKPAPEVDLALLDGGKLSLASHRDKQVVVMDFWATWCPPCVRGLPVVSKVCAEFKDKGVVFYALNQRESAEEIKEFLKKKKLEIKVALDPGSAGDSYGVSGIPQTVLIGRDGTVQAIHVGFMPSMEKELRTQLQSLVDNKALVKAKDVKPGEDAKKEPGKP